MNPLNSLNDNSFIIDDDIYYRSRDFLLKLNETKIMFPKLCIDRNNISFVWPCCAMKIYENDVILCVKQQEIKYNIPSKPQYRLQQRLFK